MWIKARPAEFADNSVVTIDIPLHSITTMPTYISLLRFTDKGAASIDNTTVRARAFTEAAGRAGVHVDGQYWLMGEYDGLLVLRAEGLEPVRRVLTDLMAAGFVRTTTVPALTVEEMQSAEAGAAAQ